jgi:hypothetical protein
MPQDGTNFPGLDVHASPEFSLNLDIPISHADGTLIPPFLWWQSREF